MTRQELFEQYVKTGLYLKGWSPKTPIIYERAFRNLQAHLGDEPITKERLESWVVAMRQQGLSPAGANIYIRAMNAFLSWLKAEGHVSETHRLRQLRAPLKAVRGLSETEVKALVSARPTTPGQKRTWILVCLLLDTGLRIEEALTLMIDDVNFDGLLLKVLGKGNRERVVPFSLQLRKLLFPFIAGRQHGPVFTTRDGERLRYRNVYRDIKAFCQKAGVVGNHVHPHAFRHCFAVAYVRGGGSMYPLSRILGHSTITTTQIYLRSMGADQLTERHSTLTPLNVQRS